LPEMFRLLITNDEERLSDIRTVIKAKTDK